MNKLFKSHKNLRNKSGAGFTIIELLVVIIIIIISSIILVSNFPRVAPGIALSRTAYKFEQDLRRAQSMIFSDKDHYNQDGILQPTEEYGVYIDIKNNKKYIIYIDKTPGNKIYDNEDYIVENVDFSLTESGIVIESINGIDTIGDNVNSGNMSVNFSPVNSNVKITFSQGQNMARADIIFALESNLAKTKTVSINTAGLIEVK